MTKIIFLGVGNGGTISLYNTCFSIQNEKGDFLIDTGGSIQIIDRLNKANIDYKKIKNIFISHSHTDHVLGLIWLVCNLAFIGGLFAILYAACHLHIALAIVVPVASVYLINAITALVYNFLPNIKDGEGEFIV